MSESADVFLEALSLVEADVYAVAPNVFDADPEGCPREMLESLPEAARRLVEVVVTHHLACMDAVGRRLQEELRVRFSGPLCRAYLAGLSPEQRMELASELVSELARPALEKLGDLGFHTRIAVLWAALHEESQGANVDEHLRKILGRDFVARLAASWKDQSGEVRGATLGAVYDVILDAARRHDRARDPYAVFRRAVARRASDLLIAVPEHEADPERFAREFEQPPEMEAPADPLELEDLKRRLEGAGLSKRERELALALAIEGGPIAKAGRSLGVSASTARTMAAKIREKLRSA